MLIALNGISKSYQASHGAPPYQVLKDANLSIDKGEMVAIKGSSGAGKSTLLHIIGCLDKPTSGSYLLNGQNVSQLSLSKLAEIRNASFGFVMQHFALIEEDSALQNVATPLLFAKARRSQMDARAMEQLRTSAWSKWRTSGLQRSPAAKAACCHRKSNGQQPGNHLGG